jgi:hypothetical protein
VKKTSSAPLPPAKNRMGALAIPSFFGHNLARGNKIQPRVSLKEANGNATANASRQV